MVAFIDQEANEKAAEIDAKVNKSYIRNRNITDRKEILAIF